LSRGARDFFFDLFAGAAAPARCAGVRGGPWCKRFARGGAADSGQCPRQSNADASAQKVLVSAAREPLPLAQVAADVVLITPEAWRDGSADSLADVLRREAGVQLFRNGGPGQNSGVSIRGAATGQTVVLVDGVRVGSATLGAVSLEGLSLAQVARIEVLRGPASSLYGADAVGGVVMIFTQDGAAHEGMQANANMQVGSYASHDASLGLRGKSGAWMWSLGLSSEGSDGVSALLPGDLFGNHNPDRDGFKLASMQASLGWQLAPGQQLRLQSSGSRLNAQYDSSEFLPPNFSQDPSPDFRNRLRQQQTALRYEGRWSPSVQGSIGISQQQDDLRSGASSPDAFRTDRKQAQAQLSWQASAQQRFTLALESLREQARSSSYLAAVQRRNHALVLAADGQGGAWAWQAEVRRDDASDFGSVNTGRLGLSLALGQGLRVRALAGNTFRAPSFNDLYFPGYGVPTLRPERGRSLEAGLDWRGAQASLSATLFSNRVRDLVAYEPNASLCPPDPSYSFGCARNLKRAKLQGLSLVGGWQFGAWNWRAVADALDAKDSDTGARLARRAKTQARLALDHRIGLWTWGADLAQLGARPDAGAMLPSATTLDLRLLRTLAPGWRAELRVNNASDEALQPLRDYQGLGRQWWLGLRYSGAGF
jgi:vitamin B12 transporter